MNGWQTVLAAFIACFGFSVVYNVPKKSLLFSSLGGALGWAICLYLPLESEIARCFLATLVIGVYAEIFARILRQPATLFILPSVLPMVPGGGIYYTFQYALAGDAALFTQTASRTFATAGVMAIALLLVSSATRLYKAVVTQHKKESGKNV